MTCLAIYESVPIPDGFKDEATGQEDSVILEGNYSTNSPRFDCEKHVKSTVFTLMMDPRVAQLSL